MMKKLCVLPLFIALSVFAGDDGFQPLFDGKTLNGWTAARSTGEGDTGAYSVNAEELAIHVYAGREPGSKQITDCLVSDTEFSHFILKVEYKKAQGTGYRSSWRTCPIAERRDDASRGFLTHGMEGTFGFVA